MAAADGDHARAAELHLAAAEIYGRIPDVTDRMLALALAAAELTRAGDPAARPGPRAEVRTFALRNDAPGPARAGRPADQPDRAGGGLLSHGQRITYVNVDHRIHQRSSPIDNALDTDVSAIT